jgi:hypothetical protein
MPNADSTTTVVRVIFRSMGDRGSIATTPNAAAAIRKGQKSAV